jgi:hypothetical protein
MKKKMIPHVREINVIENGRRNQEWTIQNTIEKIVGGGKIDNPNPQIPIVTTRPFSLPCK